MPTKNIDLVELMGRYGTEDACRELLKELRWPDGVRCPRCEEQGKDETVVSEIKNRNVFECDECGYQFSVRVGTIFHDSKLPLAKWFLAAYIMCESRKGVSANQLKRMLKVSYKTAWFLCHRIREAMKVEGERKLLGVVEADETYLGGEARGKGSGYVKNKAVVMGAVERDGQVRLRHVPNRKSPQVSRFVKDHVSSDATLYTDAYRPYKRAARKAGIDIHGRVDHSRGEWVNGKIHTNTIEGVFSLLDRSIMGAYHKVSKKHLTRYLDEVEWRYNNRKNPYLFRDTLLELIDAQQLEYKELITNRDVGSS
jgi:transposase-like protein